MALTPRRMCMALSYICFLSALQQQPVAIDMSWMPAAPLEVQQAAYGKAKETKNKTKTKAAKKSKRNKKSKKSKAASDAAGESLQPEMTHTAEGLDACDAAPAADCDVGGAAPAAPAASSNDASAIGDADADDIPSADGDDDASVVVVIKPRHQAAPKACAPDAGAPDNAPAPLRRCSSGGSSDGVPAARRLTSNSSNVSSGSEWGSETSEPSPAATAAPSLANIGSDDNRAWTFEEAVARTAIRGSWADEVDEDEEECGGVCTPLPMPLPSWQEQQQQQQPQQRGGSGNWWRSSSGGGGARCPVITSSSTSNSNNNSNDDDVWTFEQAVAMTKICGRWADEVDEEEAECGGIEAPFHLPLRSRQEQQQKQQGCGGGYSYSSGCDSRLGGGAGGSWRGRGVGGGFSGGIVGRMGSAQRCW
ncbi:MAG: hypothetical protein J3K34DRAFT_519990 [Monoraphidium minutum]|nr:MAG: hypothetical protein J3K34DRAFT_519990 [Monoraphidium minutum]